MTTGSKPDAAGMTGITLTPGHAAETPGLPDVATLTRLANAFFTALPGATDLPAAPGAVPSAAAGSPVAPADPALQLAPAAAAGLSGRSPQSLVTPPAPADAEAAFYFLRAGEPSTPRTVPALNLVPPGLEPGLGITPPASATALDPRSVANLSAPPAVRLGSTPRATPGVEVGALPAAGATPPASAFELPDEAALRALPAALAGAAGSTPQHGVAAPTATSLTVPFYFLDGIQPTPPRRVTSLHLPPRYVNLEPVQDLELGPAARGGRRVVPRAGRACFGVAEDGDAASGRHQRCSRHVSG
ncbi:MAG: hypothetical protein ABW205_07355 [Burkholderiales bacterium]